MEYAVHRYSKANNRYKKNYDKSKESSYIQYLDANNLYGATMSEKLPINEFKWVNEISRINEKSVKSYDKKNSDKGYILEVDVDYPSKLHKLHSDMPFLPERIKIDKTQKLVCNLRDKKKYVVHISILKQALNHGGIITELVALRPKTYSYMTDEFIEMKKAKGTKKCVIKKMLKFEDYKKCLFDNEPMLKSQQRFKSKNHEVYTENINKIAFTSNDDKRIVALDGITSYPYRYCGED